MSSRRWIVGGALIAACSTAADQNSGGTDSATLPATASASDSATATTGTGWDPGGSVTGEGVTGDATAVPTGSGTLPSSASETGEPTTGSPGACADDVTPGPTIVRTTAGAIEGEALGGGVVAFRGVRYVEPPTGPLRFKPPVPRACAPGVTPAQQFGAICPQVEKDAQDQVTATHTEEDCLFLNVWTPGADDAARPVMVFVHGGGNATGAGSSELYEGAALAAAQDVVVVTFNYRLGVLGFLTHPALAEESGDAVSGNYGTLDQIAALQWVRDNIAGFGGDPERVLVFGESAGAVDTCTLIGSPKAAGLFDRAIVQSGACGERTLAKVQSDIAGPWVQASGCGNAPDVAGCLRGLDVAKILTTQPDGYPNVAALSQGWGPHVDGVVLPQSTLAAMAAGAHNKGPVIFGANAAETAQAVPPMTVAQYEALVQATFGPLAQQVLAQYPAADYNNDGDEAYVALSSDVKCVCNARRSARAADAGQTEPVYRYHFAYDAYNALPNTPKAAFHGLELVYIFANWDAVLTGMIEYQPNADDLAMSARMQAAWAQFARTGDPAAMGLTWPEYVTANDNAALLDEPPGLVDGVRTQQCDFWDMFLP